MTRVLIIYAGHIGDLVMATPVLEHLRNAFGEDICIDWLARASCNGIFHHDLRINSIFSLNHMTLPVLLNLPKLKVILHSWRYPYDLVISLNIESANRFMCAIRGQRKITPDKSTYNATIHKVEELQGYYLQKLFPNQSVSLLSPSLCVPTRCNKVVLPSKFLVLVVTISKFKSQSNSGFKSWPLTHWRELIVNLLKHYPGKILLTHAPKERRVIDALLHDFGPRLKALSPKLTDLISILKQADAVISADTGPAHIANAIGTPTVTLFGPTQPGQTGPYKQNKLALKMQANLDCIGCLLQTPCSSNRCMQQLSPTEVCHAILELLHDTETIQQNDSFVAAYE